MKRLLMISWLLLVAYGVSAQEMAQRSNMYSMLCNKIVEILALDGERKEGFVAIYSEYAKDTRTRGSRGHGEGHGGGGMGKFPKGGNTPKAHLSESLTDEQIEEQILNSFDQAIHSIEVKKEYYTKFRSVLSPSEISKMYEFERKVRDRALEEQRRRAPGGRPMPNKQ